MIALCIVCFLAGLLVGCALTAAWVQGRLKRLDK